jgi:raffinose/stachyose/melibiose transport system permease protein
MEGGDRMTSLARRSNGRAATGTPGDHQQGRPGRPSARAGHRAARRRNLVLAALVVPAFALFALFVIYPLLTSVRYSFYNWDGTGPLTNFIGLRNYSFALFSHDFAPQFWRAVWHNVYFFIISMILTLAVGLGLAYTLLLVSERASRRYTIIFMLPFTLPPVVVGYIWTIYLQPNFGVYYSAVDFLHLHALAAPFLGSTTLALPTIAVITAWVGMGFPVLIFLAALIEVPKDLLDAAAIDGAGRLRILFRILIPVIRPTILVITSLNFIGAFSTFDLIYIMEGSQAGPASSTDVLGTLFYRTGFGSATTMSTQSMGLATAIAVVGFVMVVAMSGVFLWIQKRVAV